MGKFFAKIRCKSCGWLDAQLGNGGKCRRCGAAQ